MNFTFKNLLLSFGFSLLLAHTASASAPITEMPDEITTVVFSFLPTTQDLVHSAGLTCKKWHEISQNPISWEGKEVVYGYEQPPAYITQNVTDAHFTDLDNFIDVFPLFRNLQVLSFDACFMDLTKDIVSKLPYFTAQIKNIKKLNINNCFFTEGLECFACAQGFLCSFGSIGNINELNSISNKSNEDAFGIHILNLCGFIKSFKKVSLSHNNISSNFLLIFPHYLNQGNFNLSLTELDFSNNHLGDGFTQIATLLLNKATSLKKLDISNNDISDGAKDIIREQIATRLEELVL